MSEPSKSLVDDLREVPGELRKVWDQLPERPFLVVSLVAWVAFFHFLGNSTFGYVKTASLFGWMKYVLTTSEGDELGLYMPLLVIGIAYWRRNELLAISKQKWWPGFFLVLVALALHSVGFVIQQTRLSIVAFFLGVYGIMGMAWGWRWLLGFFFPFCLFVFCVPLATEGERITLPMRLYATKITASVCQSLLGIPVISDGTRIFDPMGKYQYEIAAACSGIKSLSATVAIAMVGGFLFFTTVWRRWVTILAAFPLAVLGNVLRLTAIVVTSEAFGQAAGRYLHDSTWLSLIPYIPAIGGVILLVKLLQESRPAPADGPPLETPLSPGPKPEGAGQ